LSEGLGADRGQQEERYCNSTNDGFHEFPLFEAVVNSPLGRKLRWIR
jgi:hypothetical protein